MTESDQPDENKSLAELLVEHKLLHQAQIDLAIGDQEMNDIPLEEILVFRGWITQEKLYEIAPWLKDGPSQSPKASGKKTGERSKLQPGASASAQSTTAKTGTADSGAAAKPAPPEDLPKQPPLIASTAPALKESPLSKSPEETLKAYKEVLRKILTEKES